MNESENKKRLGGHRLLKLNCRQFVYSLVRSILEHTAIPQGGIFKDAQKICRTWKLHRGKLSPCSNRKQAEDELGRSVVTKQNNLNRIKEIKDTNE
jgi:hypothetical protein